MIGLHWHFLTFLYDPCLLPSSAAFTLQSKCQESINSGSTHSDHRESISWHVLVPRPVPVPGSVCVPVALSRTGGNERALMLVPVTDAQHHHPPSSPPALFAFPSDTVRMGPCTDLQVAPLPGKKYVSGVAQGVWMEQAVPQFWLLRNQTDRTYGSTVVQKHDDTTAKMFLSCKLCYFALFYSNWVKQTNKQWTNTIEQSITIKTILYSMNKNVLKMLSFGQFCFTYGDPRCDRGERWAWGDCSYCLCDLYRTVSRLERSQIQDQPHSYLFHKLRSKCRSWQIRPGSGTTSLRQLLSRNSPSMPCWG